MDVERRTSNVQRPTFDARTRLSALRFIESLDGFEIAQTQSCLLELSDSSQGCCGVQRPFPLTPALSPGERENVPRLPAIPRRLEVISAPEPVAVRQTGTASGSGAL